MMEKLILWLMISTFAAVSLALFGYSRYQAGYDAAVAEMAQQYQAAEKQLQEQQRQASQAYQAAKAEREAAEQIRKGKVYEITQRDIYRYPCFDPDGLRELNAAIGQKPAAR